MHLVGNLPVFPHINDDARSKSHQINMKSLDTIAVMPTITAKNIKKIFRFKQVAIEAVKSYTLIEVQNTTECNLTLIAKFTNCS